MLALRRTHLTRKPRVLNDLRMNTFRRLHPILLPTWLVIHAFASLLVMTHAVYPKDIGLSASLPDIFLRNRAIQAIPGWLPNNLVSTMLFWWFLAAVVLLLLSAATRALAAFFGEKDYSRASLDWALGSRGPLTIVALLVCCSILGLIFPSAFFAVALATFIGIGVALQHPFLLGESVKWTLTNLRSVLYAALLISISYVLLFAVDFSERRFLSEVHGSVGALLLIAHYFAQLALTGLLISIAVFDIETVKERGALSRFASPKYLFAWVRLHYRLALISLWVLAPIMVMANVIWFVAPTLKWRAQGEGRSLAWPIEWFVSAADRLVNYWYLAVAPIVAVIYLILKAKMIVQMEEDIATSKKQLP
jgi:hypothetical protein